MSNSNPDPGGLSLRARKKQQARERILSAARQLIAAVSNGLVEFVIDSDGTPRIVGDPSPVDAAA